MYNNLLSVICSYVPHYFSVFYKNNVSCDVASYYMLIGYKKIFELACKKNDRKTVEYLLSRSEYVKNSYSNDLILACEGGHMELVQLMIEKGATNWDSGLKCACKGGHMEIVKLMIEKGANDWHKGFEGACKGGHMEIVKLMIEKGAKDWNWGFVVHARVDT